MKTVFSVILFLIAAVTVSAQDEYSHSVTYVSSNDNLLTVTSVGMSHKKKEAEKMAIKSAFYNLFYRGIDGYNSGKPLLIKENEYYMTKFMSSRYPMFVSNATPLTAVEKTSNGMYMVTVEVTIYIGNLIRDLVIEGLAVKPASETTMEETDEAIALPSIIVVPYKVDSETYRSVLQTNPDKRSAVIKMQESFVKHGVTTIDFEGQLDAIYLSKEFNMNTAKSDEKNVITRSGADVYVVVDLQKRGTMSTGQQVNVDMKAYDTKTGGILASTSSGWTNAVANADVGDICAIAIQSRLKDFMKDLSTSFARQIQAGKTISLRIFQAKGGKWGLDSQIGDAGYTLSSIIRRWVKKNAENGRAHLRGGVNEMLWFDSVSIPPLDEDGFPLDAPTWGDNLLYYLNHELKIPCKMKFDGTSIDITLQ